MLHKIAKCWIQVIVQCKTFCLVEEVKSNTSWSNVSAAMNIIMVTLRAPRLSGFPVPLVIQKSVRDIYSDSGT